MLCFFGKNCLLVIFWAGCLLLCGQTLAQSTTFEVMSKQQLELEVEQRKSQLAEIEKRLGGQTEELKLLQTETKSILTELAELEQQFAESGVAPQAYADVLILLQTMRVQLKIDLAGLQARQEFLRADKPAESRMQIRLEFLYRKLEVAKRIEANAFEMREKAQKSHSSGIISSEELNKAKIDAETASMRVVELEAELFEAKASLEESSQPTLAAIQQTGLEIAEKEARLKQVEAQLKATAEVGPGVLQTEIKRRMLGHLERERERLLSEISEQELEKRWATSALKELEAELGKR